MIIMAVGDHGNVNVSEIQSLAVSLLRRLRDEQAFPSLEALRKQIEKDLKEMNEKC